VTEQPDRWAGLRYGRLLPIASRSRASGRLLVPLVGRIEFRRDPGRRVTACNRIARALGVPADRAAGVFLAALESEVREEFDSAWFMAHEDRVPAAFAGSRVPDDLVGGGPAILATLHYGSPVLGFVHLRRALGLDLAILARPLDASNPMPRPKSEWARRKVAWTERVTGRPFLSTDPEAVARARAHLLAGGRIYTPVDVPGDVSGRRSRVGLLGGHATVSGGIEVLARLTGAVIQPIVTFAKGEGFAFWFGRSIETRAVEAPLGAAFVELERAIRDRPDEWWMWPYLDTGTGAPGAPATSLA